MEKEYGIYPVLNQATLNQGMIKMVKDIDYWIIEAENAMAKLNQAIAEIKRLRANQKTKTDARQEQHLKDLKQATSSYF